MGINTYESEEEFDDALEHEIQRSFDIARLEEEIEDARVYVDDCEIRLEDAREEVYNLEQELENLKWQ
jgi:predicted transposase YbfD/YdcC